MSKKKVKKGKVTFASIKEGDLICDPWYPHRVYGVISKTDNIVTFTSSSRAISYEKAAFDKIGFIWVSDLSE